MLAAIIHSVSNNRVVVPLQLSSLLVSYPAPVLGIVRVAQEQPRVNSRPRPCRATMTTLAESVGRENIPEPAAKLQKLSPPPEPPLLVKKLSEHATLPTRASAKAAGYDLSRWGGPPANTEAT